MQGPNGHVIKVMGPMDLRVGVRLVVIADPDANTIEVMQET